MRDIRYKWNAGLQSVGISNEVELPQFRVLGHRQRQTTIHLSTGRYPLLFVLPSKLGPKVRVNIIYVYIRERECTQIIIIIIIFADNNAIGAR